MWIYESVEQKARREDKLFSYRIYVQRVLSVKYIYYKYIAIKFQLHKQ
jgi:hypothetical protein